MNSEEPERQIEVAACGLCIFWLPGGRYRHGECRRRPPPPLAIPAEVSWKVAEDRDAVWPQVYPDDWCGEFVRNSHANRRAFLTRVIPSQKGA